MLCNSAAVFKHTVQPFYIGFEKQNTNCTFQDGKNAFFIENHEFSQKIQILVQKKMTRLNKHNFCNYLLSLLRLKSGCRASPCKTFDIWAMCAVNIN